MHQQAPQQQHFFKIHEYLPSSELMTHWAGGFTPEECDKILHYGERQQFDDARVGSQGGGSIDLSVRNSKICWLQPTHENDWVFHRLVALVGRINYDMFQLDLTRLDAVQYTKYGPAQHYNWHLDIHDKVPGGHLHRKLSIVVLLNEPGKDFEGGDFQIAPSGNTSDEKQAMPIKLKRGDVFAFYSFLPHRVAPVTKGERATLVSWVLGPRFK